VGYAPEGHTLVTASDQKTLWVWDTETGSERAILCGHAGTPTMGVIVIKRGIAFGPSGDRVVSTAHAYKTERLEVEVWEGTPWIGKT
jgi:hypothetical protein